MSDFDRLSGKIDRVSMIPEEIMRPCVARQIERVSDAAKLLCPGHSGELRQSIRTRTETIEGGVRGTCYTNKSYAAYVEFGTGPNGQENHKGISPAITPAYVQHGWMMPAKAMSREEAEAYGLGVVEKDGKVIGYRTNGQQARPFMYPALKDQEEEIVRNLKTDIGRRLRKI